MNNANYDNQWNYSENNQGMGQHKGKGPKGYKRSDERIKEDINDCLSDDPHLDASDIEVNVSNGEVSLSGTVSDRQAKRRAEDMADAISGVQNVENRLRVKQEQNNAGKNTSNASSASASGMDQNSSTSNGHSKKTTTV